MNHIPSEPPRRQIHPGSGRRKAPVYPKGRLLQASELDAVRALLGDRPRRRDLLIEYLHLIQDAEGCLPAGLLHGPSVFQIGLRGTGYTAEDFDWPRSQGFTVVTAQDPQLLSLILQVLSRLRARRGTRGRGGRRRVHRSNRFGGP